MPSPEKSSPKRGADRGADGSVQAHADESKRKPHPDGEWIFVHESNIARVELHYVPEIEAPSAPIEIEEVDESSDEEIDPSGKT